AAMAAGAIFAFQRAPPAAAQSSQGGSQPPSTGQQLGGPQPAGAPTSFADLAERLSPAVVNISTTTKVAKPDRPRGPNLPETTPFRERGPELCGDNGPRGGAPARPRGSLGSGFVISKDGYIVTNNHVIDGADEIKANFSDGRSLTAELIGTDPKTDVALLKVEPDHPLDFVDFGDSDHIRVGDWVLAIGNPFGLGGSVSAGIISARNRDINAGPYDDFLQTDAAINRGNSGGPLFDMHGQVVGVNTAIISPSGGSIGIGFAIPSTIVKNVVDQLQEFGTTKRGWLGVSIQEVTPDLAEGLGLDKAAGALVSSVIEDGPAQKSGLQNGDVILRFDGREVEQMRDLPRMVAETKAGKAVKVEVWRKGEIETVDVTLGLMEDDAPVINASADAPAQQAPAAEALGMTLKAIDAQGRAEYSLADDIEGVLVESVDAAGPAAEKGLRPGDVIVEVAQEAVSSPDEVKERVEKAGEQGRKSVLLLVSSRGELRFIAVSLEK
ncbi:MAG: DegQ family serine endoprotease, partial [Pseudomonadota bacterium]|nr:DegQ family serine endoprotease [Pseudomonadota bacterium]